MKKSCAIVLAAVLVATAPLAAAQELKIGPSDTVESTLAAHKGKRVTLRLRSGQEATGTVTAVTGKVVQISAVVGKEFFDAVIPLEAIEAVFIRTRS